MSTNATSGFTTVRTDLTGTLCNATGLKKATGYYFRVRAVRVFSSGEKFYSEYSNVGCGTPMDRPELTVVQSGNNALLSWPASSGATGVHHLPQDGRERQLHPAGKDRRGDFLCGREHQPG